MAPRMWFLAKVISVDLAKQLLENRPGSLALVVSTETLDKNGCCLCVANLKPKLLRLNCCLVDTCCRHQLYSG